MAQNSEILAVEKCFCPTSTDEAVSLLNEYGRETKICAGGTDLFVLKRKGKSQSRYLMDLSGTGLDDIRADEDGRIHIGAMATLTQIHDAPLLRGEMFECLREAADHVGSKQIRNMATAVGNICTGLPSADVAVALLALDTQVKIESSGGSRCVPLTEFFVAPREIALAPDEIVTEVILPKEDNTHPTQSRFRKIGPRREVFISIFSIALQMQENPDHTIGSASIAMGVMAPVPIRLKKTEIFLRGKVLDNRVIREALSIMQTEVQPRSSYHASGEYRRMLAQNILRYYLEEIRDVWE